MAITFFATRSGLVFKPMSEADALKASRVKADEPCMITVSQPRNIVRHRHFFAMLSEVLKQWPESRGEYSFKTPEHLLDALKYAIGYFEPFVTLDGKQFAKLKSISFAECDQPEFMEKVWHPCVELMAQMINVSEDELIKNTRHL